MTKKQKRFADEYLIDLNAAQAAIRAGYSARSAKQIGQELLTKPDLKSYIETHLEKLQSKKIADAAEVMQYLTSVLRGEPTEEVVQFWDGKEQRAEKMPDVKDRNKAAELLGKRYQLFTDKQLIDMNNRIIFEGNIPEIDD